MITQEELQQIVYETTYRDGLRLYGRGEVKSIGLEEKRNKVCLLGKVKSGMGPLYQVRIIMDQDRNHVEKVSCDCQDALFYSGPCKHCVAVLLKMIHMKKEIPKQEESLEERLSRLGVTKGMVSPVIKSLESSVGLEKILNPFREEFTDPLEETEGKVSLEPHLTNTRGKLFLSLKIGITQKYVLRDIVQFVENVKNRRNYYYGKKLEFVHRESAFAEDSRPLLSFVLELGGRMAEKLPFSRYSYAVVRENKEFLEIPDTRLDELMEILEPSEFYGDFLGMNSEKWRVLPEIPDFHAVLRRKQDGAAFSMRKLLYFKGNHFYYFPREGVLRKADQRQFGKSLEFFRYMQEGNKPECNISKKDLPVFLEEILPDLENVIPVKFEQFLPQNFLPEIPKIQFYLDMPKRDMIVCKGVSAYGAQVYQLWSGIPEEDEDYIRRNRKAEREAGKKAAAFFRAYDREKGEMALTGEEECYLFLTEKLDALKEIGEVFVSDAMKSVNIRTVPKISVGLSLSGNLLRLTLDSELPMEELAELLSKYDRKKKYYRLKNGKFLKYDQETINSLSDVLNILKVSEKALGKGEVKVLRYRALYLDERLKGSQGLNVEKDRSYKSLIRNMKTVEDSDFEIPESLKKTLREYQKKGFLWLKTISQNGFGGILADDMGLGKTLQVIAFLLSVKEESREGERKRSLIVAPASLIYNWENEIGRFAPGLRSKVLSGTAEERRELLLTDKDSDVFVTSYDLLERDSEIYGKLSFFCQVIDEAQYIKNAGTKRARAVKSLDAQVKIALTGTPVENRLSELWSIFDYLMPGFLYSYEHFKKNFETPIVKNQDEEALKRLRKMIQPFILRRLKKEVLSDLPDKIEKNAVIPLSGEQWKLYKAHIQRLKLMLETGSDENFGEIRMQVLAELTRLRQLCCDPSLVYEEYKGGSAKVELCMELLKNAVNGGHKILLFSQFTSMLEILKKRMEEEGLTFYSLTGTTPKDKRIQMMEAFNQDETQVFCISLKAGGTGLNLTGADIVIHYDPWWNLAAETQATDRAHRIGQKHIVTVYKLVAEHTVEEKVIELQQRKKELADQILSGAEMASIQINREELLKLFSEEPSS